MRTTRLSCCGLGRADRCAWRADLLLRPHRSQPSAAADSPAQHPDLITANWDDLLRVAASVHGGHATAALVVDKLCSSKRQQNTLTAAIKKYGALRRTIYAARYLSDETYRRRIGRQLNKGENVHTLKRHLAYANEGSRVSCTPRYV